MPMTIAMAALRPGTVSQTSPEPIEGWVAAAQEGDREALEFFVEAIEQRVYRLAWRLVGDRSLAEDTAQEALLKICRRLRQYSLGTNLWAWIYRIVVNEAHDLRRSRATRELGSPAPEDSIEYDPARAEQVRRVMQAMHVLSEKERHALVLIDMEGFSSKEAATVLGCLSITARTRAAQARKRLRQELARFYPELEDVR